MLEVRNVKKFYLTSGVKRTALAGINLEFPRSEFVAILGPSGSGKTTLLNIIGGLDHYTSGDLLIDDRSTKQFRDKDWDAYRNHRIGFVFQSYNLIPHQTILQNVRLALTLSGISKKESIRRAKKALRDVGLGDYLNQRPAQLSGGQMQRVAIARALVNNPEIVLADEPTGALDSTTSVQIMDLLAKIAKEKLVIMVTHNPELADEYADRIVNLKDGKIISDSRPFHEKKRKTSTVSVKTSSSNKRHRTKMSFFTALSLSFKNLLTKKARTALISVAGSIGIIGIALISAVSAGFQNYINTIEEDTLNSYPFTLMEESADVTGMLLSITGNPSAEGTTNEVVTENQIITGTLGSVSHNDLASFMDYLNAHKSEVEGDIRIMENQYNVDPLIYTIDTTGELAKLNPTTLFSSLLGESSLFSSYSSLTSVFQQEELANLTEQSHLVAGRYPENYNELVISLEDPGLIPDLMTYSLGFHKTNELNEILTKIMSGEAVSVQNQPLKLTHEQLLAVDLRLIPSTSIFRYNEKYDVYEDMSNDEEFMEDIYQNHSERLKIVGVITPSSDMSALHNGIFYLPSLVTHIIEESANTEITKRQLANPDVNIFSGQKFSEDKKSFDFKFSDLVSVDESKIQEALGVDLDESAIQSKTKDYIAGAATDIDTGVHDVPAARNLLTSQFTYAADALMPSFQASIQDPEVITSLLAGASDEAAIQAALIGYVDNFVNTALANEDFGPLANELGLPQAELEKAFSGLLKAYFAEYLGQYMESYAKYLQDLKDYGDLISNITGEGGTAPGVTPGAPVEGTPDNTTGGIPELTPGVIPSFPSDTNLPTPPVPPSLPAFTVTDFLSQPEFSQVFDALSVASAEIYMQQNVISKIAGLAQYLTTSFANAFHVDESALVGAFNLNFSEGELTRVVSSMFNEKEATLASNLSTLGYQDLDEPTRISFYFNSFDAKTRFVNFLDNYNEQMEKVDEAKVIDYNDTTGILMSSVKVIVDAVSYVLIAFVSISLVVSSIMIGVITYISVYERTKEIGILRAIGASKYNISNIFNAETVIIGLLAGLFAILVSYLLIPVINAVLHHFTGDIPLSAYLSPGTAFGLIILSVILTFIGGLIPAHSASKKDPVEALRSE